jgi:hypothetical protein
MVNNKPTTAGKGSPSKIATVAKKAIQKNSDAKKKTLTSKPKNENPEAKKASVVKKTAKAAPKTQPKDMWDYFALDAKYKKL